MKNHSATISSLPKLVLKHRFILGFLWVMAAGQVAENRGQATAEQTLCSKAGNDMS